MIFRLLESYWVNLRGTGLPILLACTTGLALELAWPAEASSTASRRRGVLFRVVNLLLIFGAVAIFQHLMALARVQPLITIDLGRHALSGTMAGLAVGWIAAPVLAAMIGDFFFYWLHRLEHASGLLWRFHSVHHAIRELNAWNCNNHLLDGVIFLPFVILPNALLIRIEAGNTPALFAFLLVFQGIYIHSSTRLHLGPLRWLIVDNRYHRLHHALEGVPDRNFANFTPIWDILFGTAQFPDSTEWPRTGLAEQREAIGLDAFLFAPFRRSALDAELPEDLRIDSVQ